MESDAPLQERIRHRRRLHDQHWQPKPLCAVHGADGTSCGLCGEGDEEGKLVALRQAQKRGTAYRVGPGGLSLSKPRSSSKLNCTPVPELVEGTQNRPSTSSYSL